MDNNRPVNRSKENAVLKNSLGQSHDIIKRVVKPGDTVIDATAGNGGDTLFLAGLVGPEGRVFSFDIQEKAIEKTREKLSANGLADRVTLICDGHQNMDMYAKEKVRAAMFNLGYLPGGDHNIGTRGESTAKALEKAMELLEVNGIITMVIYYGGDSGFDEKESISEYITKIDSKKYAVIRSEFVNQINCPPILVCIEKLF
jgi:tRNA G37 N-methylase Trm5